MLDRDEPIGLLEPIRKLTERTLKPSEQTKRRSVPASAPRKLLATHDSPEPERRRVARDIPRSTQARFLFAYVHDRNRRLRRNAIDLTEDEPIEHQIPDHGEAQLPEPVQGGGQ
jgi:hypothetical protein